MQKNLLSLPVLLSLVVGNMIGTGIYVLPASLAQYGTISILAWCGTGVGALLLALTFAKLNQRYPQTGGPFIFCQIAFGPTFGCIIGYTYWLSNMVSIAAIAVSSISYLGFLTPSLNANASTFSQALTLGLELSIVWLLTGINLLGLRTAGFVQLIITILKITPLLLIIAVGFGHLQLSNIFPLTTGHESAFAAMSHAATLTFWGFIGLESATITGGNVKQSRDVYIATVFGTLATIAIYLLSTIVLMGMIPLASLSQSQFPYAIIGNQLFGPLAALMIAGCAVISGIGALNACILNQGQIAIAMGKVKLLPHLLAKKSKTDVPIYGQLFAASLISVFLILTSRPSLLKHFDHIALIAGLLTMMTYLLTALAEIKFALQEKKRIPLSCYLAGFAALYALWMILYFDWQVISTCILLLILTLPLYYLRKWLL